MADKSSILKQLKSNVLFKGIDEPALKSLLQNVKELKFKAGEMIFDDASRGEHLYLLQSGKVKICKTTKFGNESVLATIDTGDFFGELELIDNKPRSARAVAISDSHVICFGKKDFNNLLSTNHVYTTNLLHKLSLRLRSINSTFLTQVERNLEESKSQLDKMNKLIEATKTVNSSLDTDKLLELILNTSTSTVQADRGTLYLIDSLKGELWSKVLQGAMKVEIRLPIGKGIAGFVAQTGETINIPDAYSDARFNPEIDKATGYRTKTILCMPMKNKDGKIIGVFQLLNKVSGPFTKEDEEFINALSIHASIAVENAQLAQKMVQNESLSAVGRMAGTIIHDIKNPMGTIRVYAQVIEGKAKDKDEEIRKHSQEIIRQVDRFVAMTQEILDFSRGVSSMNIQEIDFGELLEAVLMFIEKDLTKRKVKLIKNLQFSGNVKVDQDKLMRVFYNIAGNAADAMPDGGQLTVNSMAKDGTVVIEFVDSGSGMPPEVKARIFEPFVTHGKKHGTGLGMAIVKKVMDDHKGKIEIESELGKGTTIRLLIPMN
ncbi:MAG TPA: ATP-binding protein [Bacteroidota bacterium]|nr:ATP-binding protein [Bacteroidota bacterium]